MKSNICATAALTTLLMSGTALAASNNYEYTSQPNLAQINVTKALHSTVKAYIAYPNASTSVVVAILDGRADINHVDLKGKETTILVYKGLYNKTDNHATHVSGIIGALQNDIGVVGVDPFATLLNIPVFDQRGWVANDNAKAALDAARVNGARVVNMSYGSTAKGAVFLPGELSLFQNYNSSTAGQGMLLVRAAGNDGINILNQTFAGDAATALSNLIIVGSVNSSNVISTFSNRPGNACIGGAKTSCNSSDTNAVMNFFIVAPGENILSDLPNNYLGYMSGTSMAAPHVAGAAALVFQYALAGNTELTPGQVASILEHSARDLGVPGIDSVYGWGLLDVAAALQPVGTLAVTTGTTVNGGVIPLSGNTFQTSSVMNRSSVVASALSGMMILDDYNRAFILNAPAFDRAATRPPENPVEIFMTSVSSDTAYAASGEGHSVSFAQSGDARHGGFTRASYDDSTTHIELGLGASTAYGSSAILPGYASEGHFSRTMAETFFNGSGDTVANSRAGVFVGTDHKLSQDTTFSTLYIQSVPESYAQMPGRFAAALTKDQPVSSLVKTGLSQTVTPKITLGASYGLLAEEGQTLGTESRGAFSLGSMSLTHIGSLNASADMGDGFALSAFAERSITSSANPQGSLFSTSDWTSSKYGASLVKTGVLGTDDLLKLTALRPWTVDSGSIRVHLPVGRELDGTVNYENRIVALGTDQIPLEFGLAYMTGGDGLAYGAEFKWSNQDSRSQTVPAASAVAGLHWSF